MKKLLVSLFAISVLLSSTIVISQTTNPVEPSDTIPDLFNIPISEYMRAYDAYFDSLEVRGVDLDSSKEYKHYARFIEALRYSSGFPDFTLNQYADDYQDWLLANDNINSCVINSQFPYLSFEEVGPTYHIPGPSQRGSGTGQIHYVTWNPFAPSEMYACTNYGGLFRSDDTGNNWYQAGTDKKIPSTAVSSIALSPFDPSNTWYLSTGNGELLTSGIILPSTGVWRTSNGGASYQLISVPDHTIQQLNDNPSLLTPNDEVYYSARTRKVITLQNGGNVRLILTSIDGLFQCANADAPNPIWTKIADGQFYDVEVNPSNQNIIYACGDYDTPLIQYDLLTGSLQILQSFSNIKRRVSIEFCQVIDDFMYVMIAESTDGHAKLYKYDFTASSLNLKGVLPDDGAISPEPGVGYERGMAWAVSPVLVGGKVRVVWGNVGYIRMLEDDLTNTVLSNSDYTTIMHLQIHDDQHYMRFNQSATTLYVGNDGGLYKTDMAAPTTSWQSLNSGLSVGTANRVSTSQNGDRKLMSSYQDMGNHIQIPQPGSIPEWYEKNLITADGTEDYIHNINSDKMWYNGNHTGRFTTNGWTSSSNASLTSSPLQKNVEGDAFNNDIMYGATLLGMQKRDNFTGSWFLHQNLPIESGISVVNGYNYPQNVYDVFVPDNPQFGDYVYVYWRGGTDNRSTTINPPIVNPRIYRSKVGGGMNPSDWELVYQFQTNSFGHVVLSYSDPDVFWVSEGGTVYKVDLSIGTTGVYYSEGLEEGLSYSAVRDMIYVRGSNDGLYVATKRGLYYRDNDNYSNGWIKICAGLPNTPIYDLEIDYCRNKIIVATYGRGIWESDIDLTTSSKPYTVSTDQTFTGDFYPGTNIIVEPGATLTVTGTLYMSIGSKIIVKPNGRLVVDGGTITNGCGSLWGGIEVWGDKSQSQFDISGVNAQGEVLMTNGAIIEHAEVAVRLIKPGDWNSSGGFIRAYNSTFRNNKKDVEFAPYSNDYNGTHYANKSYFSNVVFTWDVYFRREIPLGHVTMYKVDGINFSGCTFDDDRIAGTYPSSTNCIGIRSIDSKYRVSARCTTTSGCTGEIGDGSTTWDPTIFENLYFGIYASNATNLYTVNIDRCQFIDNGYGVELVSVPSPVVIRNQFMFTANSDHFATSSAMYGIHAINSKGLKIEENNFVDMAPGAHGFGTIGIVSSDLGQQNEENRNNTFTGVTYANYAQGLNRSSSVINEGLQFLCNENYNNLYDHRVVGTLWDIPSSDYGVKRFTGDPNNPVGTIFTLNGATNEDYYSTSDHTITYYFYSGLAPVQANIDMVPTSIAPSCPSTLTDFNNGIGKLEPGKKDAYINDFHSYTNLLATKEAEYLDLSLSVTEIAYILSEVDNLAPNNKQSVRQMLNSYSPYLTTEILFEVADNAPSDFNHPWLRDLLIANIESVTDDLRYFYRRKIFHFLHQCVMQLLKQD